MALLVEQPQRPRSVTVAATLLAAVAVGYLVDAVALVAGSGGYPERVRAAISGADVDPRVFAEMKPLVSAFPYVAAGLTAVTAMVLLGIGASVRAGQVAGRILAWIAAGLSLLCGLCGVSGTGTPAISGLFYLSAVSQDDRGTHTFYQRLPAGYPAAYRYLSAGFGFLALLAMVAVIVLLARPSANRFFRPAVAPVPAFGPTGWAPIKQIQPIQQIEPFQPFQPPAAEPTPDRTAQLSILERQRQRGELTNDEYLKARQQLLHDS